MAKHSGHEVGILDVAGGGEEARRVDHGAGAEQDAVAVDDKDAAVGGEGAEDLGGAEAAGDPVERDRGARRLIEAYVLAGADVERAPVDNRAWRRLIDNDRGAALALDRRRTAYDLGAVGSGCHPRHAERHQRRGGAQAWQVWMHRSRPATAEP